MYLLLINISIQPRDHGKSRNELCVASWRLIILAICKDVDAELAGRSIPLFIF